MRGSIVLIALMAGATGGLWWYAASRRALPTGPPIVVGTMADEEKHLVTPEMERAGAEAAGRALPPLRLVGEDGGVIDLGDRMASGPMVLIFIKEGCPCSEAAEPFFRRLHAAYGERVAFLGVIDGAPGTAARWVTRLGTPFPVVVDSDLDLARSVGVTNSAYVAVVGKGGRIERLWPGFSAGMLGELSGELAALAGVEPAVIDTEGAPIELYTGCPFEFE